MRQGGRRRPGAAAWRVAAGLVVALVASLLPGVPDRPAVAAVSVPSRAQPDRSVPVRDVPVVPAPARTLAEFTPARVAWPRAADRVVDLPAGSGGVSLEVGGLPVALSRVGSGAQPATTLAVLAGPTGESGDFTKTDLNASYSWTQGGPSGDFTWSYPIDVPDVPGGLVPAVGLSYNSGAVDGQTAGENSQPSWIGEGWVTRRRSSSGPTGRASLGAVGFR